MVISALLLMGASFSLRAQYDTDVFYIRGRQALADGKYAQAIDNFNILTQLDTTDYWTFFFRGIAKYDLGDLRGAQADFNTSVRLNPVFTNGYHYRAITLSRFGRYEEALADLETAVKLRPGYVGLYFTRGVTFFLSQQFDKAIADFDRYIRKEPKDPSAYLNRGASYLFLGDTLKAVNDYNKAIKIDRFDPEGFMRRGRLYAAQGDYVNAIADMSHAIELDSTNTRAYFDRAIMAYERNDYISAMGDLNTVLRHEPGNALSLYNRGLINAQVGEYEAALEDLDRVLNINPENVLAYFNRASVFINMERWEDALDDYDKAISLYPDFAKAYMNRSYVKRQLGRLKSSKEDYDTAQRKVREYRAKNSSGDASFADTTKKYSSLLALDADFAQKDFDDELLQHRDIDIHLRPLYRYVIDPNKDAAQYALSRRYENPLLTRFEGTSEVPVTITDKPARLNSAELSELERTLYDDGSGTARNAFLRSIYEGEGKRYNSALNYLDMAIDAAAEAKDAADGYENYYRGFYYMNRGVLRAEMIDFISSMDNSVQVLTMDDANYAKARVKDVSYQQYDYSEAIADMEEAAKLAPGLPYIYFNLGNLLCLSSEHLASIENYTKAIGIYPYMGDAYYNRGLVLIYLKDKEKGCIDLSRAGELGVAESYAVIKKYCEDENDR
ncbi:MAG: tetratricopeptide repeat protein [Bacteroidales bacterium]|nr:tetratricopeptide repeat protein [Candidatus Cryptobacteroides caccocaballi]